MGEGFDRTSGVVVVALVSRNNWFRVLYNARFLLDPTNNIIYTIFFYFIEGRRDQIFIFPFRIIII